jgi:hypothetical protein
MLSLILGQTYVWYVLHASGEPGSLIDQDFGRRSCGSKIELTSIRCSPQVTNIAWTCPNATNSDTVSTSLTTLVAFGQVQAMLVT